MLSAADIMTRDVVTVSKSTSVRDLAKLFAERHISSIPVLDAAGNLEGVVSETDLIEQDKSLHIPTVVSIFDWVIYLESDKKFEKELKKMTGQTVGDICSYEVATITSSTTLPQIADLLSSRKINAVPVVEGKKVVGMVARIDLIRSMVEQG